MFNVSRFIACVAVCFAILASAAQAQPAASRFSAQIEEELLRDGISLPRLGHSIELGVTGGAVVVTLRERATNRVVNVRTVEKLPADERAAIAQLTIVVTEMLRERGLSPVPAAANWSVTFTAPAVIAQYRPKSVTVVAAGGTGRTATETRAAATALIAAYRAAGLATDDARSLGELGDADDAAIVGRASTLPGEAVAVVRVFLDGTGARAVVTLYERGGKLVSGFSAVAGEPLPVRAAPEGGDSVADQIMRDRGSKSPTPTSAPSPTEDAVVRLWIQTPDPRVRLLEVGRMRVTLTVDGAGAQVSGECAAPCGEVIDGRRGREFMFVGRGLEPSKIFDLRGRKGDVTATVKPGSTSTRNTGWTIALVGLAALTLGAIPSESDDEGERHYGGANAALLITGVAGTLIGCSIALSNNTTYSFTPGRPK